MQEAHVNGHLHCLEGMSKFPRTPGIHCSNMWRLQDSGAPVSSILFDDAVTMQQSCLGAYAPVFDHVRLRAAVTVTTRSKTVNMSFSVLYIAISPKPCPI